MAIAFVNYGGTFAAGSATSIAGPAMAITTGT